ncbi:MAG: N-acetyltransferase family protein [Homoserinimonas sp.]
MPDESSGLREVTDRDLPQVLAIYNHYVATSTVTFDEQPLVPEALQAKADHIRELGLPFIVVERMPGEVVGFAYVAPWRPKAAYRHTVECSLYLAPGATGKGLGREMMAGLLGRSKEAGIREVIAVIADQGAEASVALHQRFGFREIGHLSRVGYKFERWLGTILMQKSLADD